MSDQPIQISPDNEVVKEEAPRTHDQCVRRAFVVFSLTATAPVLMGSIVALAISQTHLVAYPLIKNLCVIGLITVPAIAFIGCVLESVFFVEVHWPETQTGLMSALGPAMILMLLGLCPPTLFIAIPFYFGSLHRKTALLANRPQWNYLTVPSLMVTALTIFLMKNVFSLTTWVCLLICLSPFVSDIIMTNWVIKYRRLKLLEKPTRTRFQFSLRTLLVGIWMLGAYVTAFILLLRE